MRPAVLITLVSQVFSNCGLVVAAKVVGVTVDMEAYAEVLRSTMM
jgi:hypothetical protein